MENGHILLKMKGITKHFPGVLALDNVGLEVDSGEVLAILGENGAGKSTMLKILAGAFTPDKGEIFIDGEKQRIKIPSDAQKAGVSIIYQELNYYDELTVAENIFVGRMPKNKAGIVKWKESRRLAKKALEKVNLDISPKRLMKELSTAEKQLVEIAKAISKEMRILVMDEPTAALNDTEVDNLIKIIKHLAGQGIAIIYISHRIEELFLVSDKVEVLRDGKFIGVYETAKVTRGELVKLMVGREIAQMYPKKDIERGRKLLEVEDLNSEFVKDINFHVNAGEILGIFGLMGSGRTHLCEALFGVSKTTSGTLSMEGKKIKFKNPKSAKKAGLAYVPSERKNEGLILMHSVKYNLSTAIIEKMKKFVFIDQKREKANAKKWVKELKVDTPSIDNKIESLSGGNQQKVVLGKWLETKPEVIIMNEPTRGVDVGAKVEIYTIMEELCEKGMGVVLISSEQPEILALSDRIIVMCEGRFNGEFSREEFTSEGILHCAIGGK